MKHVILTTDETKAAKVSLRGRIVLPGGNARAKTCASYDYDPARVLGAGPVRVFQAEPYEGTKKVEWRALKKPPTLVRVKPADSLAAIWILRRRVVEPILGALPPEELRLHPAELVDGSGVVDDDWVMLDVRATFPIDRDAASAGWDVAENPHASPIGGLEELRWAPGRAPRFAVARVGEYPHLVVVRSDLFDRLAMALKHAIVPAEPPYRSNDWRPIANVNVTLSWQPDSCREPRLVPDDARLARAAADAFWRLYAGEPAAREDVLASPHYAYWLARLIDGAPGDDTRAAACLQPFYAWLYARDVDGAATASTRRAAAANASVKQLFARAFGAG